MGPINSVLGYKLKYLKIISTCVILLIVLGTLLYVSRPQIDGVYIVSGVNCSCGHSMQLILYNGLIIEYFDEHEAELYGKYELISDKVVFGEITNPSGQYLEGKKINFYTSFFGIESLLNGKRSFMWRWPVLDIENYVKSREYRVPYYDQDLKKRKNKVVNFDEWENSLTSRWIRSP